jgi:hypothetical protein
MAILPRRDFEHLLPNSDIRSCSGYPRWNRLASHAIISVPVDRGNEAYFSNHFSGGNLRFTPTPGARLVTRTPANSKRMHDSQCKASRIGPRRNRYTRIRSAVKREVRLVAVLDKAGGSV